SGIAICRLKSELSLFTRLILASACGLSGSCGLIMILRKSSGRLARTCGMMRILSGVAFFSHLQGAIAHTGANSSAKRPGSSGDQRALLYAFGVVAVSRRNIAVK